MGFVLLTLLFIFLAFYEYYKSSPDIDQDCKRYISVMLILALISSWRPVKYWRAEKIIEKYTSILAEGKPVDAHCNSMFDAIFTSMYQAAGLALVETGEVIFEVSWCDHFLNYLADPEKASRKEIYSVAVLVHEAMHIRGELNEKITECQSLQRLYRAFKLLGTEDVVAKKQSTYYFLNIYPTHAYFHEECAPGKSMDEKLYDSTWKWLPKK